VSIIFHLRNARSDYAKSITRILGILVEDAVLTLDHLEQLGLIKSARFGN